MQLTEAVKRSSSEALVESPAVKRSSLEASVESHGVSIGERKAERETSSKSMLLLLPGKSSMISHQSVAIGLTRSGCGSIWEEGPGKGGRM